MERNRDEEIVLEEQEQPGVEPEAQDDTPDENPKKDGDKKRVDPIMESWGTRKKGPSDEQINMWKDQFGEVYLMSFDLNDNFVWRPVTRLEYKNIVQTAKDDAHYQEMLVQRCVLWPQIGPEHLTGGKAGTIPTLHSVIMEGSNFLEPDQAVMLVRKL
jgi:hypothetical protein